MLFFPTTTPAASLFSRKHGSGIPIHIKMQVVLIDIQYYTLLVLGGVNYIALAMNPSQADLAAATKIRKEIFFYYGPKYELV